MSDKIKPSEVSEVLQQQLQEVNSSEKFDEVGTVLTVSDGVARIYGLRNAEANELLEFENGTMAIVMNLEEDNVGCVLLGPTAGIKEGQSVKRTHRIASIRVNDNFLGRVVNPLGQAIDGLGDIDLTDAFEMPLDRKAPGVIYRQPVKEPLQTGLKAVDSMIPIGRGQRELIIGDRQTGKTAIAAAPSSTWRPSWAYTATPDNPTTPPPRQVSSPLPRASLRKWEAVASVPTPSLRASLKLP